MPTAFDEPVARFGALPKVLEQISRGQFAPDPQAELLHAVRELTEELRALRQEQTSPFLLGPTAMAEYRRLTGASK